MNNKVTNSNTTKEQERTELHRAIWQIANDLRGRLGPQAVCTGNAFLSLY